MSISPFIKSLRDKVGHDLLVLPSSSVLIFREDGRIALLRIAGSDEWMMAGGFVEPFEHPADSAVREAWEETGLHVELTHLMGVFGGPEGEVVYENADRVSYVTTVFAARAIAGDALADGEEADALGWFTVEEASNLKLMPLARVVLSHASNTPGRASFVPASWQPPSDHKRSG